MAVNKSAVDTAAALARLEKGQEDLKERLFNGGTGAIPSLYKKSDELSAEIKVLKHDVDEQARQAFDEIKEVRKIMDQHRIEALSATTAAAAAATAAATAAQTVAMSLDLKLEKMSGDVKQKIGWITGAAAATGSFLTLLGKWLLTKLPFTHYQ